MSIDAEAEVVGAGVERVDHGDVAQGEGGFAVIEVIAPLADEAVIEAKRANLIEALKEVVVPHAEGARVVGAEVVDGVEDKAARATQLGVHAIERE